MADKQGEEVAKADSESALLRDEIISLISSRLESIGVNPVRQEISKALNRRKKKWRKRHKLEPQRPEHQPLDPSLREEKEYISFTLSELTEKLVQRRREGFASARLQQREKGEYSTDAFSHWLQNTQEFVQTQKHTTETSISSQLQEASSQPNLQHDRLIQDLSSVISQATSLSEIHSMKHDMTPRLPPLQDRTLSGNILDASLGVFHLQEQPVTTDQQQPMTTDCLSEQPETTDHPQQQPETTTHPQQQPVTTDHPQQHPETTNHPQQQPVTTDHPQQHPETTTHPQQQPVTTDHPQQQPVTTDHPQQQPVTTDCLLEEPLISPPQTVDHLPDSTDCLPQQPVTVDCLPGQTETINCLPGQPVTVDCLPGQPVIPDHLPQQPVTADHLPVTTDNMSQEVVEMNGITNGDEDVVTEFIDAQLTIGKVVNVEQDSCYRSDTEEEPRNDKSAHAEYDAKNDTVVLRVDNESSDDTPGVGMEIVCGAASDLETGPFVVSQSHGLNSMNRVSTMSSSPLRVSEELDTDQTHNLNSTFCLKNHTSIQPKQSTPVKGNIKLTKKRRSSDKAMMEVVENSTDTDSDSQFGRILEIIERAPYELRIPSKNKNYSTGIRRKRRRSTPKSRGKK